MPEGQTLALQDPALIAVQENAASADATAAAPSGEFAGLSTQQYTRNRKAIQRTLDELIAGTITEVAARVFLESIGMSGKNIDLLVQDVSDGKVDTLPSEVTQDA